MSVATQHSYTPLKGLNKRTAFAFTKMEGKKKKWRHCLLKNISVLVHARPSRMLKSSGKSFSLPDGDWVSGLDQKKLVKFHFHSITVKGKFTNHTFRFGMHILRYRSLKWNGTVSSYIVFKPVSIWWISLGIQYYSTISHHLYRYKLNFTFRDYGKHLESHILMGNIKTQSVYHQMYINGHIVSVLYAGKVSITNATVCRGCISRINVCFDYVKQRSPKLWGNVSPVKSVLKQLVCASV